MARRTDVLEKPAQEQAFERQQSEGRQHTFFEIAEAAGGRIDFLGIGDIQAFVVFQRAAPDRLPQPPPQAHGDQFLRHAASHAGHDQRPQVGAIAGFVDADNPCHVENS